MTILYLYYNQPEAIKNLERLGFDKADIDIVIIDDGSKVPLKCEWATVYRIEKDVKWNQPKANNLGFSKINGLVLRMDIDHYFNVKDLPRLYNFIPEEKEIVRFKRKHKGKWINPHKNIYLANVSDLRDVGGYDERFCGNYGYDDTEFMQRLKDKGFEFYMSDVTVYADTTFETKLDRDTTINKQKYYEKTKP